MLRLLNKYIWGKGGLNLPCYMTGAYKGRVRMLSIRTGNRTLCLLIARPVLVVFLQCAAFPHQKVENLLIMMVARTSDYLFFNKMAPSYKK